MYRNRQETDSSELPDLNSASTSWTRFLIHLNFLNLHNENKNMHYIIVQRKRDLYK